MNSFYLDFEETQELERVLRSALSTEPDNNRLLRLYWFACSNDVGVSFDADLLDKASSLFG